MEKNISISYAINTMEGRQYNNANNSQDAKWKYGKITNGKKAT